MTGRIENTKNIIEIIAILCAGAWAIYVFIYQEHLAPSSTVPRASIEAEVIGLSEMDNGNALKLKTKFKNNGKARVHLVGYWFNVVGFKIQKKAEISDEEYVEALRKKYIPNTYQIRARRAYEIVDRDIIDSGTFVDDSWFFDQDDVLEQEKYILVSDQYDLVYVHVYANIAKKKKNIRYRWEIDPEDGEMRQVKALLMEDGSVEDFDIDNEKHMELRQEYGLGLIKSEAIYILPRQPNKAVEKDALPRDSRRQR